MRLLEGLVGIAILAWITTAVMFVATLAVEAWRSWKDGRE